MTKAAPPATVIYIVADNRSGSTLLDYLLGAHPQVVTVGEIHHLRAYITNDRRLYNPAFPLNCSCGTAVTRCAFWNDVEDRLGSSLKSLRLALRFLHGETVSKTDALMALPRNIVASRPEIYRNALVRQVFDSRRVALDSFRLFEAICDVSGTRYVVDSSKSAFRYRSLYEYQPERTVAITLARDYRAIAHSKMKRGRSLESSTISWVMRMRQIKALTKDVPEGRKLRIRYEDLCADPEKELTRVCSFLGLKYYDALLRRPHDDVHHIGGSPSQFDPSRTSIKLDTSYLEAFSQQQLEIMKQLVDGAAAEWGYD